MPNDDCRICDLPQAGHGRRYTAGYGDHEWMRPRPATPAPIPHPLGGITYPTDPHDPAGDRLFYGRTTA